VIAVDVTPRLEAAPAHASASQRERIAGRIARTAPEAASADFLIHTNLKFEASPLPSYFRYARATGERSARQQLPRLLDSLQRVGLHTRHCSATQKRHRRLGLPEVPRLDGRSAAARKDCNSMDKYLLSNIL
jgi:NTE family protein